MRLQCQAHACACRYFIYLNWMPSYFHHMFGMDVKSSSLFSFLPWMVRNPACRLGKLGAGWGLAPCGYACNASYLRELANQETINNASNTVQAGIRSGGMAASLSQVATCQMSLDLLAWMPARAR